MKLSEYARRNGIKYRAAWNRYEAARMTAFANSVGLPVVAVVKEVARRRTGQVIAAISAELP